MENLVGSIALFIAITTACLFIRRKSKRGRLVTDDCIKLSLTVALILAIIFF